MTAVARTAWAAAKPRPLRPSSVGRPMAGSPSMMTAVTMDQARTMRRPRSVFKTSLNPSTTWPVPQSPQARPQRRAAGLPAVREVQRQRRLAGHRRYRPQPAALSAPSPTAITPGPAATIRRDLVAVAARTARHGWDRLTLHLARVKAVGRLRLPVPPHPPCACRPISTRSSSRATGSSAASTD